MGKTKITVEPGKNEIVMTREFAAPRDLLFKAHTDPELLVQWLGPRRMEMTVDKMEVRNGGVWRYIHREPDGNEHAFHGVFHGTPSEDGIVQTFEYEATPGHVSLDTLRFEERGDRTVVRVTSVFQSVADRDAMAAAGMESGVNDGYDRLDELVARLEPVKRA
ncbi:MAG TPA: SRPBCC family protein [Candidatus Limnocylindrales bacterium]|nr:SRPBCC family protein [Candidatus Limnocylindrales bacterium]